MREVPSAEGGIYQWVKTTFECRHLDPETYWTLGILLNTGKLKEMLPQAERKEHDMANNVIDEIWEHAMEKGIEKGIEKGMEKGKLETLYDLVHDDLLSIKDAAARTSMTESVFMEEMQKAGY